MLSRLLGKKEKMTQEQEQEHEHDLFKGSCAGDLVSVMAALAGGQNVNTRGGVNDLTCLIEAVLGGHKEEVTVLLHYEDCDLSLVNYYKGRHCTLPVVVAGWGWSGSWPPTPGRGV